MEMAEEIQNAAVPFVWIQTEERIVKVLSNMMVDITKLLSIVTLEVLELRSKFIFRFFVRYWKNIRKTQKNWQMRLQEMYMS